MSSTIKFTVRNVIVDDNSLEIYTEEKFLIEILTKIFSLKDFMIE